MTNKILHFAQKGLVFSQDKKSLLFIKPTSKYMPDKLNGKPALPGGKVDFGEEIDVACVREIQEETGLLVKPGMPVYTWAWTYKKENQSVEIIAIARVCSLQSGEILENDKQEREIKINQVLWVPIDQINREDCVEDEWPAIEFVIQNTIRALEMLSIEFVKTNMFKV